jgi:hypothetical protein
MDNSACLSSVTKCLLVRGCVTQLCWVLISPWESGIIPTCSIFPFLFSHLCDLDSHRFLHNTVFFYYFYYSIELWYIQSSFNETSFLFVPLSYFAFLLDYFIFWRQNLWWLLWRPEGAITFYKWWSQIWWCINKYNKFAVIRYWHISVQSEKSSWCCK